MAFAFTQDNINEITEFLFTEPMSVENSWIWQIHNKDSKQALVLTIHNSVAIGAGIEGSLISVQTHQGYYELHNCAAFMIFEPDEIIFISADKERVSSLIISRECTCSVYSNVARDILYSDFSKLDPAVLLSAMQLSLTEAILPE